ncbi:Glutamyl-tRNA(Gln) amidotransferase subunit A [Thermodesulfobium narugense DSM 14796]|uniref:Glutamyl-tRNA(Gln) amidotransferase subunit A n=1 Tax=Thermodesulfobium narugense DSM 14796 TaxID=747365 RepID=M1E705_9BACT|nr:Asp-tRNA(Asn)/Glu-tRNA(Gln) amidotransferase subunit GatA [Thermodesulfobium narugense]AEE14265.1 Glutamyl-tRNA(Gln) amidotransferase subunit A [Thermodesulfobium narugense DSM 14796]
MEINDFTINSIKSEYKKGNLTPKELLDYVFKGIKLYDSKINSFITLTEEYAYKAIESLKLDEIDLKPLWGIPVAIKDNMCFRGFKTTCSSKILENFIPIYTATAVQRLIDAGAIIVGKTNLDEFAMGSSTENSAFFTTSNPWDLERVPGGSSGGSASAVAARFVPLATGSDTGGSIRQPASFCGVVGFKPTYGTVSRYGLVAFASSLDQIGPFGTKVKDVELAFSVMSGKDDMDSTSHPYQFTSVNRNIKEYKVGVIKELYEAEGFDIEVLNSLNNVIKILKSEGLKVDVCSLPHLKYSLPVYYLVATSEASSNLARFDGVRYGLRVEGKDIIETFSKTRGQGFGSEVKRRIMLGTYALSSGYYDAYYLKASKVRTLIVNDFEKAFREYDFLICPTSPTTAFKKGDKTSDPLSMYLSDIATIPVNLAGLPGISIPSGCDNKGLPIGLQIIGRPFNDSEVLNFADQLESIINFEARPQLGGI